MVPLRSDYDQSTNTTWSETRRRPRLVLHDYSPEPVAPSVTRVSRPATSPRRASRRWEGAVCALAVAAVLCFVLVTALGAVWHSVSAQYASSFAPAAPMVHVRVGAGDTLWQYAARYGDPNSYILDRVETIARDNHIASDLPLAPGQTLRIAVHNPVEVAKLQRQHEARLASASR